MGSGLPRAAAACSELLFEQLLIETDPHARDDFATGLGKVRPEWPTGVAAPLQDAPQVVAPVAVFLDDLIAALDGHLTIEHHTHVLLMRPPVKQRQDYADLCYFLSMCLHEAITKALTESEG